MIKIIIDEYDRDKVQRADVETSSLANLLTFMVNNNVNITNERFQDYEKRYKEAYLQFEKEKANIEKKYLKGTNFTSWSLSYEDCEITYNV